MIPFLLLVGAYVGVELLAARSVSHRFDATYVFDQFAAEDRAVSRCGSPEAESLQQFRRNLEAVKRRARKELGESQPGASADAVEAMLAEQGREREREVDAIVDERGCADPEVATLLKRFEIHARLGVGGPAPPGGADASGRAATAAE